MGRDKALLSFHGSPLAQFVARTVASAAGSAVLVGDPDRYHIFGYPVIADLYPGAGPLSGILTALSHTQADWNLVVACDMPRLSAKFLSGILETAEQSASDAVLPVGPGGRLEALCAAYHRSSRDAIEEAFTQGERKITAALKALRILEWPTAEATPFQNVNTPEDWAPYAGT